MRVRVSLAKVAWGIALAVVGFGMVAGAAWGIEARAAANRAPHGPIAMLISPAHESLSVQLVTKPGASCSLSVSSRGKSATLPKARANRSGRVTFKWGVPLNAPSGTWVFAARCVRARKTYRLKRSTVILTGGNGSEGVLEWESLKPRPQSRGGGLPRASVAVPDKRGLPDPKNDYPSQWASPVRQDSVYDNWSEENRECTSFVAWALATRNGFNMPFYDNATGWGADARARGYQVNHTPADGSVAWAASGHVAYVEEVLGGNVRIEEYNHGYPTNPGTYDERTVPAGNFEYIHFADVEPPSLKPPTAGPGIFGALSTDGTFSAKQGIEGGWVTETGGIQQIAIGGETIGALSTSGTFSAKQGIGGGWVTETGGIQQIAIGGEYIGALSTSGTFSAKKGIEGGWVTETGTVKQIAISETSKGPLIGVLYTNGDVQVKQGIGGGWVTETGGIQQIAIGGEYIGALSTSGTFSAKQGIEGGWVTETGGIQQIAISG